MHVAVGKVKATWEYGNFFHLFSNGYLKKVSKTREKNQVWCMLHGYAWLLVRYTPPNKA